MQGIRRDIDETEWTSAKAWDYGRLSHDTGSYWYCCVPDSDSEQGFMMGNLSKHSITEHEDGTITVSPSILITTHRGKRWHGFLERGIWREA